MRIRTGILAMVLSLLISVFSHAADAPAHTPAKAPAKPRQLALSVKPWTGDFEQMIERRMIRVLVPYSRTLYFNDRGRERGITADTVREFERYLNRKYAAQLGKRPLTVYIIPTTRDKLLSGVIGGLGDIAVGNLTITDERRQLTDFVAIADQKPVSEIVLTGTGVPELTSPEALSGRTVHVRRFEQLSRQPGGSERAAQEGRQGAGQDRARARRAGRRGHDGNARCRPARSHHRR